MLQTLEAQIARQIVVLFAHVRHEQLVRGIGAIAAFARHRLILLEEFDIALDEVELGIGDQVTVLLGLIVVEHDLGVGAARRLWFGQRNDLDGRLVDDGGGGGSHGGRRRRRRHADGRGDGDLRVFAQLQHGGRGALIDDLAVNVAFVTARVCAIGEFHAANGAVRRQRTVQRRRWRHRVVQVRLVGRRIAAVLGVLQWEENIEINTIGISIETHTHTALT